MFPLQISAEQLNEIVIPPATNDVEVEDRYKLHRRFDRMGRLVGDAAMEKLFATHVMVVGVGGVGGMAAESLARSGVGRVTLVDFDKVCVTNTNRQLQAMKGTIGKSKVSIMADRLRLINPQADVVAVERFYNADASQVLLDMRPDYVVDAIDNMTAKCHLIAACKQRHIPMVSAMGAAGRMDPAQVRLGDLGLTTHDPMADAVRRILRQKYGFGQGAWGISAVYSLEPTREPIELHYDNGEGFRCVCPGGKNDLHSCEERRVIYGTASFVTGIFGLYCSSFVVRHAVGNA